MHQNLVLGSSPSSSIKARSTAAPAAGYTVIVLRRVVTMNGEGTGAPRNIVFNGSMVALGASGEGSNPSIPNIGEGDVSPGNSHPKCRSLY